MVAWSALILPAVLSAVFVFIASSLIHMVVKWHNPDYRKLPNEDEVRDAIRRGSPSPGEYAIPHAMDCKPGDETVMRKWKEGPVGFLIVRESGMPKMGVFLGQWFVYTIVISLLAAYVARTTVSANPQYYDVFQVVGAAAWLAYAWEAPQQSIWKGQSWSATMKYLVDGLIYAALTAGTFAWLWPNRV